MALVLHPQHVGGAVMVALASVEFIRETSAGHPADRKTPTGFNSAEIAARGPDQAAGPKGDSRQP